MNLNLQIAEDEPLVFDRGRSLGLEDLALLSLGSSERTRAPSVASPLQRLRSRHHALAKALAEGMRPGIAAATFGYSASRISILQADPAFIELLNHYAKEKDHDYARVHERLTNLSVDAMDEIATRLEDKPEEISVSQLTSIVKLTADRTGFGPKTTNEVNVNIGLADRLREARKRLEERKLNIIDLEALPPAAE